MNDKATSSTQRSGLIPRYSKGGYSLDDVSKRREWLQQLTNSDLKSVGSSEICPTTMQGNIENLIGTIQVPLGIAGPQKINGQHAQGTFYVPLATTEGALVRSYERGMMAITKAGGATVRIIDDGNTASPIFVCQDVHAAAEFAEFVSAHFTDLKQAAEATTQHGELQTAIPRVLGRDVIVDFRFQTGDAHGMNMIAKATHAACQWLVSKVTVENWYVMSGASGEKRSSAKLFSGGKGKYVTAGVKLPAQIAQMYLGLSPNQFVDLWRRTVVAQMSSGVVGFNGHYANGLTALFLATGQDVANVMNSAVGITNVEIVGDNELYISVTLPSLTVATVGGGTGLGTSAECLAMLDCAGAGKVSRLAEIAAATVLAGELSFGASLAAGDFVDAHEQYGRNRPETDNGPLS